MQTYVQVSSIGVFDEVGGRGKEVLKRNAGWAGK